jgi:hypothetical protein
LRSFSAYLRFRLAFLRVQILPPEPRPEVPTDNVEVEEVVMEPYTPAPPQPPPQKMDVWRRELHNFLSDLSFVTGMCVYSSFADRRSREHEHPSQQLRAVVTHSPLKKVIGRVNSRVNCVFFFFCSTPCTEAKQECIILCDRKKKRFVPPASFRKGFFKICLLQSILGLSAGSGRSPYVDRTGSRSSCSNQPTNYACVLLHSTRL